MLVDRDKLIRTAECVDEDLRKQNHEQGLTAAQAVKIVTDMVSEEKAIPVSWIQEYIEVVADLDEEDPIRMMVEVWEHEVRTGHALGYRR